MSLLAQALRTVPLSCGLFLIVHAGAQAQTPAQAAQAAQAAHAAAQQAEAMALRAQIEGGTASFIAAELDREKVVKGAPYCAEALHETVQPLLDGNRIVKSQTSRLCRDGEGRTRQEVERGGRRYVYLRDPVGGESWVLDPEHKTARRLGQRLAPIEIGQDSAAWREYGERMREWSRKLSEQMRERLGREPLAAPPMPPQPPVPPAAPAAISGAEVRVLKLDGAAPQAAIALAPPLVHLRAQGLAPRGAGVSSPLGSKEIEGLKVHGERSSWTIAAGTLGNDKPIVITRDVWTSPELMLTVATRDFDPRSGEVNYRLQNIRRGEPDPALMRVPADYELQRSIRGKPLPQPTPMPAPKG
jgi:hypothetical protein